MSANRLVTWERLTCPSCPSIRFYEAFHIKWHPNNGTTREPSGIVCRECGNEVDMQAAISKKQIEHKKAELAAMEAEVNELAPANGNGKPPAGKKDEKKEPAKVG